METIRFKRMHPDFVMPVRAHETDACFDVVATSRTVSDGSVTYGMGFATEIPEGWAGYFYARSSISNTGLVLCNSVGIIDASYRGEWMARFRYLPPFEEGLRTEYVGPCERQQFRFWGDDLPTSLIARLYKVGDRIGQIRFAPLPLYELALADELSDTPRGTGGFGSTGA